MNRSAEQSIPEQSLDELVAERNRLNMAIRAKLTDPCTDLTAEQLNRLFEHPGMPTVLACFYRGRSFNKDDGTGYTTIFAADGSEVTSIGADVAEVDEAYYSLIGLENLAEHDVFAV
ncbi:hypothetical protein [Paraburkholderia aromaticivorans]|uniref:Uncharacterized protein n=1 Tax=Paraburkholderia aromaticivorans TaxID=2026199 RepID=A0A248VXZ1_9BURK|nr:hypothetical protein [Paraburkholderia aromaticivorans]ASW03899.1 hypothetical protein CJU94_37665 [Paraburkholderia aromaticivorans]